MERGKGLFGRLRDQRRPARLVDRRTAADVVDAVQMETRGLQRGRTTPTQWRQVAEVFLTQGTLGVRMSDGIAAPVHDYWQHIGSAGEQFGKARDFLQIEFAHQDAVPGCRSSQFRCNRQWQGQRHNDVFTG